MLLSSLKLKPRGARGIINRRVDMLRLMILLLEGSKYKWKNPSKVTQIKGNRKDTARLLQGPLLQQIQTNVLLVT